MATSLGKSPVLPELVSWVMCVTVSTESRRIYSLHDKYDKMVSLLRGLADGPGGESQTTSMLPYRGVNKLKYRHRNQIFKLKQQCKDKYRFITLIELTATCITIGIQQCIGAGYF